MPTVGEKIETIASLKWHRKIWAIGVHLPIPITPLVWWFFYYLRGSMYFEPIVIGAFLFIGILTLIGVVFERRFNTGGLVIIGFAGILILGVSTNLLAMLFFLILWISFDILFFFYLGKDWKAKVIEMDNEKISVREIAGRLKISEKSCKKTIQDYQKVVPLYKQGKSVEETRIALDISRREVRDYWLIMDEMEHKAQMLSKEYKK